LVPCEKRLEIIIVGDCEAFFDLLNLFEDMVIDGSDCVFFRKVNVGVKFFLVIEKALLALDAGIANELSVLSIEVFVLQEQVQERRFEHALSVLALNF